MSHVREPVVVVFLAAAASLVLIGRAQGQQQGVKQRTCIKQMNKGGEVVAQLQGNLDKRCVRNGNNGDVPDVDACVTNDPFGKVGRKKQSTIRRENHFCLRSPDQNPDFGKTDATTVNNAATGEEIALLESVFGAPVQAAIISCGSDAQACKCQWRVVQFYEKLMFRKIEGFRLCKKPGLRHGTIIDDSGLENCMGADPRGKVANKLHRLQVIVQKECVTTGVNQAVAFPGTCATAPDLSACLDARTSCYACRMLNAMDGLSKDCDAFDDGLANVSCPP